MSKKFKTFRCPKCLLVVEAIAIEVAHRCPSDKTKVVTFRELEDDLSE
jgi:hypothetical protein